MQFRHQYRLPLQPSDALALHRDHVPDFGPRLPGVGHVERVSFERSEDGGQVVCHEWHGDLSVIPMLLRSRIGLAGFRWSDRTVWDSAGRGCLWNLGIPILGEGARIEGRYSFDPCAGGTQVNVDACLLFDIGNDSPFVQNALGRRLLPVVERFVVWLFKRVIGSSADVIRAYAVPVAA